MKRRLLAACLLSAFALLLVDGVRLIGSLETLHGLTDLGLERPAPGAKRPEPAPTPAATANPRADSLAEVPPRRDEPADSDVPASAAEPEIANIEVNADADGETLRSALQAALNSDDELRNLVESADPEIRAGVIDFLRQQP